MPSEVMVVRKRGGPTLRCRQEAVRTDNASRRALNLALHAVRQRMHRHSTDDHPHGSRTAGSQHPPRRAQVIEDGR